MKVHVKLSCGLLVVFAFAGRMLALGAPAAGAALGANPAPIRASIQAATSSNGASGQLNAMEICFSVAPAVASAPGTMYLTAAFEVPVATQGATPPVVEPAFSAYLKATYQYQTVGVTCQPIWTIADAQQVQKKLADLRDRGPKVVDTGWRYGQPPLAPGQSGFDPLAQGLGGLDFTQHRLTTYMCTLDIAGGTTIVPPQPYNSQVATRYLSPLFQADWDPAPVSMAYSVYIRDHYVHDLNPSAVLGPRCSAQSPAVLTGQHQTAMVGTKLFQHVVPVDFTYTPAQAAGGNAALAQVASATQTAAAQTAAATLFISCSTSGSAGVDTYYTGVFEIGAKPGRSPHPPNTPGAYIGGTWMVPAVLPQTVLDHFYAYLTQKGYKFSPGSSSACDVQPTEAATKAAQHKRAYEGGGCSSCGKVVETGWKYTP